MNKNEYEKKYPGPLVKLSNYNFVKQKIAKAAPETFFSTSVSTIQLCTATF